MTMMPRLIGRLWKLSSIEYGVQVERGMAVPHRRRVSSMDFELLQP
jgi:hypothetical protein